MWWLLFQMIFNFKTPFRKILKSKPKETLEEWIENAIKDENFELAAYIKNYLNFKYEKDQEELNKTIKH